MYALYSIKKDPNAKGTLAAMTRLAEGSCGAMKSLMNSKRHTADPRDMLAFGVYRGDQLVSSTY